MEFNGLDLTYAKLKLRVNLDSSGCCAAYLRSMVGLALLTAPVEGLQASSRRRDAFS